MLPLDQEQWAASFEKDTFIAVAKEGHHNLSVLWRLKARPVCMIEDDTPVSCLLLQTERFGVADCRCDERHNAKQASTDWRRRSPPRNGT